MSCMNAQASPPTPEAYLLPPSLCAKTKPPSSSTCLPLVILNLTLSSHTPYWHFSRSRPDGSCLSWDAERKKVKTLTTFALWAYFTGLSAWEYHILRGPHPVTAESLPGRTLPNVRQLWNVSESPWALDRLRLTPSDASTEVRRLPCRCYRSTKGQLWFHICNLFRTQSEYKTLPWCKLKWSTHPP